MSDNNDVLQNISATTNELVSKLSEDESLKKIHTEIEEYLKSCYEINEDQKVGEGKNLIDLSFDSGSKWITDNPLTLSSTKNSLTIIEFFTHCCINCIHSIEDLRFLHGHLGSLRNGQVGTKCSSEFISVHSPKFSREKEEDSISNFVKRNQMDYSHVLNDPESKLWNRLGVFCWPTIAVLGPTVKEGKFNLLYVFVGEGHREILTKIITESLTFFDQHFDGQITDEKKEEEEVKPVDVVDSSCLLRFPGKITIFGDFLGISDSGNNRILLASSNGVILEIIGGKNRGFEDGDFSTARFSNPQGLTFKDRNTIFVADTGNHSIRKICLVNKEVSTLVSCNQKVEDDDGVEIKSPWDVAMYGKEVLLIASAGNHRILGYFFETIQLFQRIHKAESLGLIAGNGHEQNRNNEYILKSSFSQPSGIAVSQVLNENDKVIYIADSESSSIRAICSSGRVMGLAGASKDPTDLFAFGDVDGILIDAKLQHPIGICSAVGDNKVFFTDTYNNKVKMIKLETKQCVTVIGTGKAGNQSGSFSGIFKRHRAKNSQDEMKPALLNEPCGITIDNEVGLLYIADTNNHEIKIADLRNFSVEKLELVFDKNVKENEYNREFEVPAETPLDFDFVIQEVPDTFEGGEWKLEAPNGSTNGTLNRDPETSRITIRITQNEPKVDKNAQFKLNVSLVFCSDIACFKRNYKFLFKCKENIPIGPFGFTLPKLV